MFLLGNDLSFLPLSSSWLLIYPYAYRHTQSPGLAFCNGGPLFTIGGAGIKKLLGMDTCFCFHPDWVHLTRTYSGIVCSEGPFSPIVARLWNPQGETAWERAFMYQNVSLSPTVNASPQKKGGRGVIMSLAELTEKNPLPYSVSQSGHTPYTFCGFLNLFQVSRKFIQP